MPQLSKQLPFSTCARGQLLCPARTEPAGSCSWHLQAGKGHLAFFLPFKSRASVNPGRPPLGAGAGMEGVPAKPNSLICKTFALSPSASSPCPSISRGFWNFPVYRMRTTTSTFLPKELIRIQPIKIFAEDWCWEMLNYDLADIVIY